MAKYTGASMVIEFDGTALGCVRSIDFTTSVDIAEGQCAGDTAKTKKPGLSDSSVAVSMFLDDSGSGAASALNAIKSGEQGSIKIYPSGKVDTALEISIANAISQGPVIGASVDDLTAVQCTFEGDGAVTYAAYSV